jgi:VWFA-related protein
MTWADMRICGALVAAIVAAVPGSARTAPQEPQLPTFRSSANAVAVDVSVFDRTRRPITNLTPTDFEILDNGVPQTVDNVSYGKLPIDITVALDVSYSVTGTLLERLQRGVNQLAGDLGRQDRLRLMLFNMKVSRTIDFTSDVREIERAMKTVAAGGSTALLDAISVALVSSTAADRRQLIVFFTDGSDSTSVTPVSSLTTIARRARATLTFVMPTVGGMIISSSSSSPFGGSPNIINLTGGSRPDTIYMTLARETGGSVIPVGATTDLSDAFQRVLNEFRSAYVVYFNARGVEPGGYHTLDVKVTRENATVQARRGYWY